VTPWLTDSIAFPLESVVAIVNEPVVAVVKGFTRPSKVI
jgi:hypothetical protein